MSDRMQISATETGLVRVFAIDLPPETIAEFTNPDSPDIAAIRDALGAEALSPGHVDLVRLADLGELGLDVDDSPVPIISLGLGNAENMQRIQRKLAARGIMIVYRATYSGLGPEGAVRLAVFATHTDEMIQRLLDELKRLL